MDSVPVLKEATSVFFYKQNAAFVSMFSSNLLNDLCGGTEYLTK